MKKEITNKKVEIYELNEDEVKHHGNYIVEDDGLFFRIVRAHQTKNIIYCVLLDGFDKGSDM